MRDMGDLFIDFSTLRRVRTDLNDVETLLAGPCRGMAELPAEAAGHAQLRDRLREFGDEWDYGIGKLGEFSKGAAEALDHIEKTFTELDGELAKSFDEA